MTVPGRPTYRFVYDRTSSKQGTARFYRHFTFFFEILIGRVDHYTLSRAVVEAESCFTCECSVHAVMHLLTSLRGQRLRGLNLSSNTKDWYIKEHYSTPLHLNEAQIRWRVNNGDFVSCLKEN